MNFSHKSIAVIFLVTSILFACKNQSKIGLDVLPQGQNIGTYMQDTFSVELTTILPDSVNTTNPYNIWVGDVNDASFGKLSATTYTQVGMSSPNFTLVADARYDSLTFTFKYGDIKFGDTTQPFTLNIHKLDNLIDSATNYYSNSSLSYNAVPLGSGTFSPIDLTNRHIDSVSIKLDDVLGNELFSKFGKAEFITNIAFNHYFKGLVLASDGNNSAIIGGSLTADSATSIRLSGMVMHYHSASAPGLDIQYRFPLFSAGRKFTNFKSNKAGTVIASIANPYDSLSSKSNSTAYIQAGSGLGVKIGLPTVKKLKEQLGDVLINRAELIIPAVESKNTLSNSAPILYMFQANANGTYKLNATPSKLPIQIDGNTITGTGYTRAIIFDYTKQQYSVLLTDYMQALLFDKINPYFLLLPATTGASNAIIGDSKNSTSPIKLKIHYSKIQQ